MAKENVAEQYISNILIVDDVPDNLKVLSGILKANEYKVRPVLNGQLALEAAENEIPDLILLDIMMPQMDGYEVCRQLKQNPKLKDIPVIFISALNDTRDIVDAFKEGGVDYITKPFQAEEVSARIATHLKISRLSNELKKLNASKDKFFSIIAHDLRGPLSGLMSFTEQLADEDQYFSDTEKKEITLELSQSARNTFNLLENLLQWSQIERGLTDFNPKSLDLKHVVSECLRTAADTASGKQLRIITDIQGNPEVFADTNMLQTVIRNLVSNAIKFTPKGGIITISVESSANNMTLLSVRDTGIGMNEEMREKLFLIGANTKRPGTEGELSTGLGLILCKEFVEKQSGKLWVESTKNTGSVFYFTIPTSTRKEEKDLDKPDVTAIDTDTGKKKLTVLIVEDDKISSLMIPAMLKALAREVLIAKTGIEAIECCRSNPNIDLVLMDIFMPEMDGLETTRQIRQFNKKIVIIAQTTFIRSGAREISIAAGCDDYIPKPFSREELAYVIKENIKKTAGIY